MTKLIAIALAAFALSAAPVAALAACRTTTIWVGNDMKICTVCCNEITGQCSTFCN